MIWYQTLLMLPSAAGKTPVATVETVRAICCQAEACFDNQAFYRSLMEHYGCYTLEPNMDRVGAGAVSCISEHTSCIIQGLCEHTY